jgi:hypothetical protein
MSTVGLRELRSFHIRFFSHNSPLSSKGRILPRFSACIQNENGSSSGGNGRTLRPCVRKLLIRLHYISKTTLA